MLINEAKQLNEKLNETKIFIQNTISSRKLIFNQAEPINMDSKSSLIGQLEFNNDSFELIDHKLKIKFLNDLIKLNECNLESDLIRQTSFLIPMVNQRLLNVSKMSYDEYSNISLTISDLEGKKLATNYENLQSKVNAVASHDKLVILSLTELKTGRDLIKLYNSSLQLITTCVIQYNCDAFYTNDLFIYAKINANYPYVLKYNHELKEQPIFKNIKKSNSCELFISFVVDKLVYFSSNTNRIYFNDKCFSRLKIFSELTGNLVNSIFINNLRDCSIRIDASLNNSFRDQFICLNKSENFIRCYDIGDDDETELINAAADSNDSCVDVCSLGGASLLAENFLSEKIRNISHFYLTKDGYYVFIDHLNDSLYFY